jgi:hypothetical protein
MQDKILTEKYYFSVMPTVFGGKVVANRGPVQVVLNLNTEDKTVVFNDVDSNIKAEASAAIVLQAARFIRSHNVWNLIKNPDYLGGGCGTFTDNDRMLGILSKMCPDCEGNGTVTEEVMVPMSQNYARFREPHWENREVECESCNGSGEIDEENNDDL